METRFQSAPVLRDYGACSTVISCSSSSATCRSQKRTYPNHGEARGNAVSCQRRASLAA